MGWFTDLVKQGFGVTSAQKALQYVGANAPAPITNTLLRAEQPVQAISNRMQNLYPQITLPRVEAPSYLPSTIKYLADIANPVNIASGFGESLLNAPRKYVGGITRTGLNIGNSMNGKTVPLSRYAADVASIAEPILDVGTLGFGGGLVKEGIKSVAKPAVKQTFKGLVGNIARQGLKMSAEGAGFGAGFGALSGLQETSGATTDEMINNLMKRTAEGAVAGAIAGPVVGGGLKILGKGIETAKRLPRDESGAIDLGYDVKTGKTKGNLSESMPSIDALLKRTKKTLEQKSYPVEKPGVHYVPSENYRPSVQTTKVLDQIHYAMSKQGEKNFDVTRTGKALEYYARKLGTKEMESAYIETLKFPKERSITSFWDRMKTRANELGVKPPTDADFTQWSEAVATGKTPVEVPQKKSVTAMLKTNKPWEEAGFVLPKDHTPDTKIRILKQDTFSPAAYPKVEPKKYIYAPKTTYDPEIGKMVTKFEKQPLDIKAEMKQELGGGTKPNIKESIPPVPPKRAGNKYHTPDEINRLERMTKQHLETWAADKKVGETRGTDIATQFVDVPEKVLTDIVNARENPTAIVDPKTRAIATKVGLVFDDLHAEAKKQGMDINYRKNFFTHIWDEASIDKMVRDKVMGRSLSGEPYFLKGQHITWQQGLDMGLVPKYPTLAQNIEAYAQREFKALANRKLVANLKKSGLAYDQQVGSQYKPVSVLGYTNMKDGSNVVYLTDKSAKLVSTVFNPHNPTPYIGERSKTSAPIGNPLERTVATTATAGKTMTQYILSGGYKNINAMGIGKLLFKELPSGNFKAIKRFAQTLIPSQEKKMVQELVADAEKYQSWGIDIHIGKTSVKDKISNKNITRSLPEKAQKIFKDVMESPTFDSFIPATQLDFAKSIEKAARGKGLAEFEVQRIVKQAMKNKYDVGSSLGSMLQNKNLHNLLDTVFFAKSLRKSTIMSNLVGNAKALRHPLALENRGNIVGMTGGLIALAGLNELNKSATGRNMWENPDGWNYAYIKTGTNDKGEDEYFRLNTTSIEYTWLKQLAELSIGAVTGNTEKVAQTAKQTLQFGLKTIVDLVTNTDWKMDKIWNPTDSMTERLKKMGQNTINQNLHPMVKAVSTFFSKPDDEQRWAKLIGDAGEIPGTFKTEKQYKTATYYKTESDILNRLSEEDKNVYEEIKQKETNFNAKQRDKVSDAYTLLDHPEVLKAQKDIALLTAKKNNQPVDPLWLLPDDQLRKFYVIQGLTNNGEQQKSMKEKEADWYSPLSLARTAFFDELERNGIIEEKESDFPKASPEVKQMKSEYFALPKGTGQRTRYAASHPELVAQWEKETAYYDRVASSFGIPPKAPYGSSSTGYGSSEWKKNSIKYMMQKMRSKQKSSISKTLKLAKGKKIKVSSVKSVLAKAKAPKGRKTIVASRIKKPFSVNSYKFS